MADPDHPKTATEATAEAKDWRQHIANAADTPSDETAVVSHIRSVYAKMTDAEKQLVITALTLPGNGADHLPEVTVVGDKLTFQPAGHEPVVVNLHDLPEQPGPSPPSQTAPATNLELPAPPPVESPPGKDQAPAPIFLTDRTEVERAYKYQNYILSSLDQIFSASGGNAGDRDKLKADLAKEMSEHQWGESSQRGFNMYVDWLEKTQIPAIARAATSLGGALPPGDQIPIDSKNFAADLGVHPAAEHTLSLPTREQDNRIEAARDWIAATVGKSQESTQIDQRVQALIDQKLVPASWKYQGGDRDQYNQAALMGLDLYNKLSNNIAAVDYLKKIGGNLDIELPPGTKINEANGNVMSVTFDLPGSLNGIADNPQFQRLENTLEKMQTSVDQATDSMKLVEKNPYMNVLYADINVKGGAQAMLDENGVFQGIFDPKKDTLKPNWQLKPINSVRVRTSAEPDAAGNIVIHSEIQAANSAPVGYDLIWTAVGEPMKVADRTVKPDDVVYLNGELIRANQLPEKCAEADAAYAINKGFSIGLDCLFVAKALTSLGKLAVKGAMEAEGIEATTLALTQKEIRTTIRRDMLDLFVGGSGFISNNAWGNQNIPDAEEARGWYFLATGAKVFVPQRLVTTPAQAQLAAKLEKIGPDWLSRIHTNIEKATNWLSNGYAVPIIWGAKDRIEQDLNKPHPGQLAPEKGAEAFADNGRSQWSQVQPDSKAFDLKKYVGLIQQYRGELSENGSESEAVGKIFDTLKNFPNLSDIEKETVRREWAANISFTGEEIARLEATNNGPLTADQIQQLSDPRTRGDYRSGDSAELVRKAAEDIMSKKDIDVGRASRIALLMTGSADDKGRMSDNQSTIEIQVPGYETFVSAPAGGFEGGTAGFYYKQDAGTLRLNIGTESVVDWLRTDLDHAGGLRRAAMGDLLVKIGGISLPKYVQTLQSVLDDPKATAQDKMHVFATNEQGPVMFAALYKLFMLESRVNDPNLSAQEKALIPQLQAQLYGNSVEDRMRALGQTAANADAPRDVRAMAAATSYLMERVESGDLGNALSLMKPLTDNWNAHMNGSSQDPMDQLRGILSDALKAPLTGDQQSIQSAVQMRIDAARTLALVDPDNAQITASLGEAFKAIDPTQTQMSLSQQDRDRLRQLMSGGANEARTLAQTVGQQKFEELNRAALLIINGQQKALALLDTLGTDRASKLIAGDEGFRHHLLDLVPNPGEEFALPGLLKKLTQLINDAPPNSAESWAEFRKNLDTKVAAFLQPGSSGVSADAKIAAIQFFSEENSQGLLDTIRELANSDKEPDALVREAAINAMKQMQDPKLMDPTYVQKLIDNEKDEQLRRELTELQKHAQSGDESSLPAAISASDQSVLDKARVDHSYPALVGFDQTAIKQFLEQNNLALLDHDEFMRQVNEAVKGNSLWQGNQIIESVEALREAQFQTLIGLSLGNVQDADPKKAQVAQQARQFLELIVAANGKPLSPATDGIFTFSDEGIVGMSGRPVSNVALPTGYGSYQESRTSTTWETDAAKALVKVATESPVGVDLNRYLIGSLLANPTNLDPDTKLDLLKAWESLSHFGQPDTAGRYIVSSKDYQAVLTRALEAERKRKEQLHISDRTPFEQEIERQLRLPAAA